MIPLEKAVVARLESHGWKLVFLVNPTLAIRDQLGDHVDLEMSVAAHPLFENASWSSCLSSEDLERSHHRYG